MCFSVIFREDSFIFAVLRSALVAFCIALIGVYLTARFRFWFFRHPVRCLFSSEPHSKSDRSSFAALCVALGGTVGVGNTAGVAASLMIGGPGSVFWMWISALFSMSLKYAETNLALKFRTKENAGGAMVLLCRLNKPFLAILFSLACVGASFGMGNLAQSISAEDSLKQAAGIPPYFTALVLVCFGIAVFCGGNGRLLRVSSVLVPIMAFLFLILSCAVLFINRAGLPGAIRSVFIGAFEPMAVLGGSGAAVFLRVFASGFERAIFSNEAGLGSAPLIHSAVKTDPKTQGLMAAAEVFFDTLVICTLCALVLLSSPVFQTNRFSASELCAAVFHDALGSFGAILFSVSLCFFAVSSMLAWCYYGTRAIRFLFSSKTALYLYYALFFSLPFLAPLAGLQQIFAFSDLCNACMVLPNLYAVFRLRKQIDPPGHSNRI